MGKLQDEEVALDREIVDELVVLTPEWWRAADLSVTYAVENGIERYAHTISSPEGNREVVHASEELFDATHRLGLLFRKHGRQWRRVTYKVRQEQGESWCYEVTFEY